jgi:F-type H+-transporting ATPase subunit b
MTFRNIRFSACVASILLMGMIATPETVLAAEEGSSWGTWLTIGRLFNLLVVVGVLFWVARKPLSNFFSGRSRAIRDQLAEAQKARADAEAKLAEVESRMSRLDDELKEIAKVSEKEAQDEYLRLLAAAEQDSQKIVERARQEIDGMTRTAQAQLKLHAAELSVQLAEDGIRNEITDADRERLFERFVANLGGKS